MAFEIEVKGKTLEIKFDYRTMFKANKKLASKNPETGQKNDDGASNLFNRILAQDDEAVFDLINLVWTGKKLTENDLFDALEGFFEDYEDEEEAVDALFNGIKEEMLDSGFFMKKLKKQIENMEKGRDILKERDDEQSQMQVKAIDNLLSSMKKEILSENAQGTD